MGFLPGQRQRRAAVVQVQQFSLVAYSVVSQVAPRWSCLLIRSRAISWADDSDGSQIQRDR
jgi:hypothetical protein